MSQRPLDDAPVDFPRLTWRIGVAMAEAGVRTNRELKRRLTAVGYRTSEPKLCRLRKVDVRSIDLELLAALCAVLATSPNELLAPPGGWSRPALAPTTGKTLCDSNARGDADVAPNQNIPPAVPPQSAPVPMLGPRIRAVTSSERAFK